LSVPGSERWTIHVSVGMPALSQQPRSGLTVSSKVELALSIKPAATHMNAIENVMVVQTLPWCRAHGSCRRLLISEDY
jgi:hypothetical protein